MNKDLGNLMKEAQKMQERMQEAQNELSNLTVSGKAGGGMVEVIMNGRHDVTGLKIKPSLLEEGAEMLEDLIIAALNNANDQIEKVSKEKIGKLTAGLNISGDFMKNIED